MRTGNFPITVTSKRDRRRARRDERGASLVEFALILPVFSLLLFGFIDFGLVFGGFISVQNEVNGAARAISINQLSPGCSGSANPGLCTVEADISTSPLGVVSGSVKVALEFPDGAALQNDRVIVCAQAALQSTTGLTSPILSGRSFYSSSEILLEQNASVPTLPAGNSFSNSAGFTCR